MTELEKFYELCKDKEITNDLIAIEKSLQALEIIKKYPKVPIQRLIMYETNKTKGYDVGTLEDNDIPHTQQEYDLLKEVLL